jgi:hypothetical protein
MDLEGAKYNSTPQTFLDIATAEEVLVVHIRLMRMPYTYDVEYQKE